MPAARRLNVSPCPAPVKVAPVAEMTTGAFTTKAPPLAASGSTVLASMLIATVVNADRLAAIVALSPAFSVTEPVRLDTFEFTVRSSPAAALSVAVSDTLPPVFATPLTAPSVTTVRPSTSTRAIFPVVALLAASCAMFVSRAIPPTAVTSSEVAVTFVQPRCRP